MLNGKYPVIIFQFAKNIDPTFVGPEEQSTLAKIPVISAIPTVVEQPPIPIYIDEQAVGVMILSEEKTIDIETSVETLSDGSPANVNQKGISSSITINMTGSKNSLGLKLISAMMDLLFDKVTSKEYSVTYLNGAITVFRGVIESFKIDQESNTDKFNITLVISKGAKNPQKETPINSVERNTGAVPL